MTPTRTAPVTSAPADDVDPALLAEIAAAAGAVPGVREAVAVVRRSTRTTTTATAPVTTPASPSAPTDKPSSHVDGGPLRIPDGAPTTLQDALRQAAELAPGKGTTYLRRGEAVLQTYPRLLAEAERVLAGLRAAGLRPGDAALFQFEDNRDYLTAFWACVLGGFVPTPVAVAPTYTEHNATNRRLHNAWTLLDRPVVLTGRATATALAEVRGLWDEPDVRVLVVQDLLRHAPDTHWHPTTADSPVLNLLTSGSTGVPKCVQHTNASVAARTWACAQERGYGPDDVTVNWMPLDHVAIVMYNVRDVFLRCSHVNAAVDDFLADPLSWLDWLDRFGATNTWAPNFAFAMVNDHAEEIGRRRWDLSRLRAITNAAEPVIAATTHRFLDLLAPHGLPPDAMWPGWGMSETCSVVTYVKQSRDDHAAGVVAVAQSSLGGDLVEVEPDDPDAVVFSEAGPPVPGVSMRVVAPDGSVLPEDALGELQVRGATMMTGYHANPEANRESYDADGWFRTGDLAFVHRGSVVIAGRKKDQIVIRGINYIAHEIESVVERVDGVRLTHVAATGVREPGEGSDRLVLFFVPQRWDDRLEDTVQAVREALVREVGPAPDLVVPVTAAEFPKTGSGKIQRGALVADLRAGRFADRVRSAERGSDDPVDWSFVRRWHPVGDDVPAAPAGGVSVVLADDEVWEHLADAFADGRAVVVRRGEGFAEDGPDRFRVAPGDAEGLGRVLDLAARRHGPVTTIVSAWSLRTATAPPRPVEAATDLAALLRAAGGRDAALLVLTSGAVHVRPGDRVDLASCALPGLVRTAVIEAVLPTVRQVDLPAERDRWADTTRAELADRSRTGVLAVRDDLRWEPRLGRVDRSEVRERPPVVAGGRYLVTGGLGGLAHDLASYLLAAYGVRLLLVGRSEPRGVKAERLTELAGLGEVAYRALDVADAVGLREAVDAAELRWGAPLDGVLHVAGGDPSAQWERLEQHTLRRESAETFDALSRAKVAGTLAVADVLESRPQASLVLFGSVNGEFGGHSFGAYSTANAFLVGFADHWRHERGRDVRCLAWSMWTDVGLNRDRPVGPVRRRGFRPIRGQEGLAAFLTAAGLDDHYVLIGLDADHPQVVAELEPTAVRAREVLVAYTTEDDDTDTDIDPLRDGLDPLLRRSPVPVRFRKLPHLPTDATGAVDTTQLLLDADAARARRKPYVAPATDLEHRLAAIWSEVLNRPTPGRDDTFYELGGNSMRAVRLLARMSEELPVAVTLHQLYDKATIGELASLIETGGPGVE